MRKNESSEHAILEELNNLMLIEDNFAMVSLLMKSQQVDILEDIPKYSWTSVMSSLGGILNLYSGITMIIALEILELIYYLFARLVATLCPDIKDDKVVRSGNEHDRSPPLEFGSFARFFPLVILNTLPLVIYDVSYFEHLNENFLFLPDALKRNLMTSYRAGK